MGDVQPVVYDSSHGASSDASDHSITNFAPFVKPNEDTNSDNKNTAPDVMGERSWYGTSTGSEAVDGIVTLDDIPDDVRYYQVKSNKKSLETANARQTENIQSLDIQNYIFGIVK